MASDVSTLTPISGPTMPLFPQETQAPALTSAQMSPSPLSVLTPVQLGPTSLTHKGGLSCETQVQIFSA